MKKIKNFGTSLLYKCMDLFGHAHAELTANHPYWPAKADYYYILFNRFAIPLKTVTVNLDNGWVTQEIFNEYLSFCDTVNVIYKYTPEQIQNTKETV